jgi:hypothetical protein
MERGAATGRDDDQGARRIDALLGGLAGSARASLEEMLDDNDFWGGGDEEEVEIEMKLLREGGAGAVREQKMQDSVQAWLLAKRSAQISCARLRRLADHSGCQGPPWNAK